MRICARQRVVGLHCRARQSPLELERELVYLRLSDRRLDIHTAEHVGPPEDPGEVRGQQPHAVDEGIDVQRHEASGPLLVACNPRRPSYSPPARGRNRCACDERADPRRPAPATDRWSWEATSFPRWVVPETDRCRSGTWPARRGRSRCSSGLPRHSGGGGCATRCHPTADG